MMDDDIHHHHHHLQPWRQFSLPPLPRPPSRPLLPKKPTMSGTAPPSFAKPLGKAFFASQFSKYRTTTYSDSPSSTRSVSSSHGNIRTLAWSPLGAYVATGTSDRTLRIWNPERPNVKYSTELRGHTGPIERVAFHPTRVAELASTSADGTVKFWDVRTGKNAVNELRTGGDGGNYSLSWHPEGAGLLVGRKVFGRVRDSPIQYLLAVKRYPTLRERWKLTRSDFNRTTLSYRLTMP
jgi:WD40 repeat protein